MGFRLLLRCTQRVLTANRRRHRYLTEWLSVYSRYPTRRTVSTSTKVDVAERTCSAVGSTLSEISELTLWVSRKPQRKYRGRGSSRRGLIHLPLPTRSYLVQRRRNPVETPAARRGVVRYPDRSGDMDLCLSHQR